LREQDRERRFALDGKVCAGLDRHLAPVHAGDACLELAAVPVEQRDRFAHGKSQHARRMMRRLRGQPHFGAVAELARK